VHQTVRRCAITNQKGPEDAIVPAGRTINLQIRIYFMPVKKTLREGLSEYLPEKALDVVMEWIGTRPIHVKLTRNRSSKLGDFRPPQHDRINRISLNAGMNPYEFLITFTHEIAHMLTWEKYGRKVLPHGSAWKGQYAALLEELIVKDIFPPDIRKIVVHQVRNPKSTSKCDTMLTRALQPHDEEPQGIFLEDLPMGASFRMQNGRRFIKQDRLRKWYRCLSLDNRRLYRISPVARVIPEEDKH